MEKEVTEIKKLITALPEQDRNLYSKFHVGEEHPIYGKRAGLWIAVSLPGGELWLRFPPREKDKITIFHEYGHYVWYFSVNDTQKAIFQHAYNKVKEWAVQEAKKRKFERVYYPYFSWEEYYIGQRAGRNIKEAFAEAYAWYYGGLKDTLRERRPEIYEALEEIEKQRVLL